MAVGIELRPGGVLPNLSRRTSFVRRARGPLAMVAATASWGVGTAVNKLTLERVQLRPMTQQAIELAASVGVLAALVGVRRRVRRCPQAPTDMTRAWRRGWPGLLEPGASYVLGLLGLSMTAATHAAVIGALEPTFVALGSWLVFRRRMRAGDAALMSLALAGALLVILSTSGVGSGASDGGDALLVVSVACAAGYVMLSARGVGTVPPLVATLTQQVWAMLVVVPVLAASIGIVGLGPMPAGRAWLLVLAAGILSYLVPFALYLTALESLPATMAAQYLALIPLCGLAGAAILLGERLTVTALAGGAVVVVALFLLSRTMDDAQYTIDTRPQSSDVRRP